MKLLGGWNTDYTDWTRILSDLSYLCALHAQFTFFTFFFSLKYGAPLVTTSDTLSNPDPITA